jgi:hypothetical protein
MNMDERMRVVLAACFAVSNMGQPRPTGAEIARLKHAKYEPTVESATVFLAEKYMETHEHYDMFVAEAQSWHELLGDPNEAASYRSSSPDLFALYEEA